MLRIYKVAEGTRAPHRLAIAQTAAILREGGLALLPTETVYGIGVSVTAFSETDHSTLPTPVAVGSVDEPDVPDAPSVLSAPGPNTGYGRIFTLKQREITQTVPWLVDGAQALDEYGCDVDPRVRTLAEAFWPGALTLVVKAAPHVPTFMQQADGTIALRASASPVIQALIKACKSPLAVTSANTHGAPAPAAFKDVEPRVLQGVDVAIDAGETPCRDASTIVSCESVLGEPADGPASLRIIRQGALPAERIMAALTQLPTK